MLRKITLASIVCLLPLSAQAFDFKEVKPNQFNYNYMQLSYTDWDGEESGFTLAGNYDVGPNLAVTASYMSADGYSELGFGVAYHFKFTQLANSDLVLHAGFGRGKIDRQVTTFNPITFSLEETSISDSDSGLSFGASLRHALDNKVEFFGDLRHTTVWKSDWRLTGGVAYTIDARLSAFASYTFGDYDMLNMGVRYAY